MAEMTAIPPPEPPLNHRVARIVLTLAVIGLAGWISQGFLRALLWGGIIAIAVAPLYARLEARWPAGRRLALPAAFTLGVAVLLLAPLTLAVVEATHEAHQLSGWLATARAEGIPVPAFVRDLPVGGAAATQWWTATLATPDAAAGTLDKVNAVAMRHSRLFGADVVRRTVAFVFALLTLFFLLRDRDTVADQARRAGERLFGARGEQVAELILLSVRGTINGLVLVGIGEGIVLSLIYLVAGVPHPLLFGALTGVAATIPMGAAVLIAVAALVLAATGTMAAAVAVAAVGLVFVFVVDHTLRPALIGSTTRLPFLLVLVGILGGVEALGLIGLFAGPATMAVLVMLWREFVGAGTGGPDGLTASDCDVRREPSAPSATTPASPRSRS
jgi:predicted PurR-regulated permease PerM